MSERTLRFCVDCGCNDLAACEGKDGPCSWTHTDPHLPIGLCSSCRQGTKQHVISDRGRVAAFSFAITALAAFGLKLYRQIDGHGAERGEAAELFNYSFVPDMPRKLMKEAGVTVIEPAQSFDPLLDTGVLELHFFCNTRDALLYLKSRQGNGPEESLNLELDRKSVV